MPFGDAAQRQAMFQVIQSLQDPERGIACVVALAGLMLQSHDLWRDQAWENDPNKREEKDIMHQFKTVLFRWLAFARIPAQRQQLAWSTCTCHAQERIDKAHVLGLRLAASERLDRLFYFTLNMLLAPMVRKSSGDMRIESARTARIDKLAFRQYWPTSLQQILPYGPEDTSRGLLAWFKTDFEELETPTSLLTICSLFVNCTQPVTFPYFVTSRTLITHGIIRIIDSTCQYYENSPRNADTRNQVVRTLFAVAQMIANTMVARSTDLHRRLFTEPHAVELTVAYSRALDVCDSLHSSRDEADLESAVIKFQVVGTMAVHDFELLEDERFQRAIGSPHKIMERFMNESYAITPWQSMITAILCEVKSQACASPDCSKTYADSTAFKHCGGCRRVVYHSRECQKRAWNHPVAPHRDICSVLRQTCSVNQLPKTYRGLSKVLYRVGQPKFNAEQGALIVRHFALKNFHEVHNLRACDTLMMKFSYDADSEIAMYQSEADWEARLGVASGR
jgi:hypothetical protein